MTDSNEQKVIEWLQHYQAWKSFIRGQQRVIEDLQKELSLNAAPQSPRYTAVPVYAAGTGKSPEEKNMERKERLQERIREIQAKVQRAVTITNAIDSGLEALDEMEKSLVKMRCMEGRTWQAMAIQCGFSYSGCRKCFYKAVTKLTCIIFGTGL